MSEERDAYQAYLLRLWRVPCRGRWHWRASLEDPRSAERRLFAGLEQLLAFLRERCEDHLPDAPEASGDGKEVQPGISHYWPRTAHRGPGAESPKGTE